MAGQLIQRGEKTWLVRVFMGRDSAGKRIYHNKTIHGNKKDAQRYLTGALRDHDQGTFVAPSKQTLDAYLDQWLETTARQRVRPRTLADYQSQLDRYVRPTLGHRHLDKIGPQDLQTLYAHMQSRGLSARTVRYAHAVLLSALEQAVRFGHLYRNPASLVDLPRQNRKEMQALSAEQVKAFLAASEDDPLYTFFLLAVTTGMRPSEYLALKWSDIDFVKGSLRVQRTLNDRTRATEETKTAKGRRTIKLLPTIIPLLKSLKTRQAAIRLGATDYQELDLVFATQHGTPLDQANIRKRFKTLLERAELPTTVRLYDLRHTCGTLLLEAGQNIKIVSEQLGHASSTLTLDVYSHVLPHMQDQAAEGMERLLFGGEKTA